MDVCVIGTGYVGLVTGACLAEIGHRVTGVDDDAGKVETLLGGGLPHYEPGLEALVACNRAAGRLAFTTDLPRGIRAAQVIFICVNTPPLPDGNADLSFVENATRRIAEAATAPALIVEKSTVPVRTGLRIQRTLGLYAGRRGVTFDVASNPEFLREGSAIEDFLHPDRIVVGVASPRAEALLRELYAPIVRGGFPCPIHPVCRSAGEVPFLVTDLESAELIKHASNSFLALKISFINAVADLCERVGADVTKVAEAVGHDRRIGPAFLRAGLGFGGSCFPKDLRAFVRLAEAHGLDFALLREVERINEARIERAVGKLREALWTLRGKRVGVLGLAYKPGTDDVRSAPALALIRRLLEEGVEVRACDPRAEAKARVLLDSVTYCADAYGASAGCEALVLATEWPEFLDLDWGRIRAGMARPLLLDGRNALDREKVVALGFEYLGMGRCSGATDTLSYSVPEFARY